MNQALTHLLRSLALLCALADMASAQAGPPPLGGPLPPLRAPRGNQITLSKTLLGKALFWDEQLSSTRTTSCGSCHIPSAGSSDPRSQGPGATHPGLDGLLRTADDVIGSPGVPATRADGSYASDATFGLRPQVTGRRAMPLINSAFVPELFWDGRAPNRFTDPETGMLILNANAALESQALGPVVSEVEMGHMGIELDDLVARIEASEPLALAGAIPVLLDDWIADRSYAELFEEAFGDDEVSAVRFAMAVATYERTLLADQTPLRDFATGNRNALTPSEQSGQRVFIGKGCATCHGGPALTNNAFRYTGVRPRAEDLGRFLVTGANGDRGRMKVPSLLNLGLRAPYFHNGGMRSIAEVVDFYDRGGDFSAPNLAPQMVPLNLTPRERTDLIAFLGRPLIDPRVRNEVAPFDRPRLYTESVNVPLPYGMPSRGPLGRAPRMVALEPPSIGNPSMTLAIEDAPAGAMALLLFGSGTDVAGTPIFGAQIHVALGAGLLLRPVTLMGSGPGGGFGSTSFAIPNELALIGCQRFAQWVLLSGAAQNGLTSTDAVSLTAF